MDRKWIALATILTLFLLIGCSGNKADTAPPPEPTVEKPPVTDVPVKAEPAKPVDETPPPRPKSLDELQQEATTAGLLGDVYFDFDRFELRANAKERLAKNADFMKSNSNLTFTVEGHCDERGTNEYNLALGQSRSSSAVDYLVSLGVPASRFKTVSYGEERPFCTESDEGCWQKNRRARFVISGN